MDMYNPPKQGTHIRHSQCIIVVIPSSCYPWE
jgi:hypothetical protein